jgi:hypothetical protein
MRHPRPFISSSRYIDNGLSLSRSKCDNTVNRISSNGPKIKDTRDKLGL